MTVSANGEPAAAPEMAVSANRKPVVHLAASANGQPAATLDGSVG